MTEYFDPTMLKDMDVKGVVTFCPFCRKVYVVVLTPEQIERYKEWKSGEEMIQDVLPDLSPETREKLKTGICDDCWSKKVMS